jgi:hypothetical protein
MKGKNWMQTECNKVETMFSNEIVFQWNLVKSVATGLPPQQDNNNKEMRESESA